MSAASQEETPTAPSLELVASNVIPLDKPLRRLDRLDPDEIALIRAALNGGCPILTNLKRTD